jgi:hypothetical protein
MYIVGVVYRYIIAVVLQSNNRRIKYLCLSAAHRQRVPNIRKIQENIEKQHSVETVVDISFRFKAKSVSRRRESVCI